MSNIENNKIQKSINFDKHTIEKSDNCDADHVSYQYSIIKLAVNDFYLNWGDYC